MKFKYERNAIMQHQSVFELHLVLLLDLLCGLVYKNRTPIIPCCFSYPNGIIFSSLFCVLMMGSECVWALGKDSNFQ